MKMIVEGVMGGNLPWNLVFAGAFIGIVVEVLGIPVLPFAVGLYLPIHLSTPMMIGGLVRLFLEKRKNMDEKAKKDMIDNGVLYCSGLIAGEGLKMCIRDSAGGAVHSDFRHFPYLRLECPPYRGDRERRQDHPSGLQVCGPSCALS